MFQDIYQHLATSDCITYVSWQLEPFHTSNNYTISFMWIWTFFMILLSGAQKRVPRSTLRSAFQFCQERNEASSNCKFVERNVT